MLLALSLAAACSRSDRHGRDGSSTRGGTGGESAHGGSPSTGGAAAEAGEGATGGDSAGGRGATGPGGMNGLGGTDGSGGTAGAGSAGEGGNGEGGNAGDAGGAGCGNRACESGEDCASCGSDCGPCSCEYFLREETYPHIKTLLKFQTAPSIAYDYSSESIKTAYALWSPSAPAIPNRAEFQAELCSALDWLASTDRFASLEQATTALSPNGGPAETGLDPQKSPYYFVPAADGWHLFARWVAHNVALELRHELPWSLERLAETNPDAALALLDSTEMMHRRIVPEAMVNDVMLGHVPHFNYGGTPYSSYLGQTIIGMPRYTFRFLAQNDLVKPTEHATAVALLEWARENLAHFVGPGNRETCQMHWGHPYPPTVEMVIEGTTSTVALPPTIPPFQHWTMGCHGTTQFIKDVLRAVNIPVRVPFNCEHAQLWLPGLDLWMDHGDDPYNQNFANSMCSADFLLTDRATFQAAFGTTMRSVFQGGVCDTDPGPVGRRVEPQSVAMCPMAQ